MAMNLNDIIKSAVKDIDDNKRDQESEEKYLTRIKWIEGVYLFISFDLVNSTLFKSRHMQLWPGFISAFYECVKAEFGLTRPLNDNGLSKSFDVKRYEQEIQKTRGFQLWKLVGDEVLLYHKIVSKDELYDTIQFINYKRKELIDRTIQNFLHNLKYNDTCGEENRENQVVKEEYRRLFQQYFDVKTTVWIGSCASSSENVSLGKPNVVYGCEGNSYDNQYDFLGPDIDEGFRLCEYAEKHQMIVSPKLIRLLLLLYEDNDDKLNALNVNSRIVNYVSMKGVWEQRLYPIIMFCQSKGGSGASLELWKEQFEYDSFESSYLYKNIDKYKQDFFQDDRFSVFVLEKIYKDIVRDKEIDELFRVFMEQESEIAQMSQNNRDIWASASRFEFHIACLCYDPKEKRYWITKHPHHGWSFGCTQVTQNEGYRTYVKKVYLEKYGIEIELTENAPLLSFYSVERRKEDGGSILGVVVLAEFVRSISAVEGMENKWISYEEMSDISDKKIHHFDLTLERANEVVLAQSPS